MSEYINLIWGPETLVSHI